MKNIGEETHSTKMGADKLAKNTPNDPKLICPNCLPKSPKVLDFNEKKIRWMSLVRGSVSVPTSFAAHVHFLLELFCQNTKSKFSSPR